MKTNNKISEDELFDFIRKNKDQFDVFSPESKHEEKFLLKLGRIIKDTIVSIVPSLIKVAIVAVVFWLTGFIAWNIYLNPEKDQMSLSKVSLASRKFESKHKIHELSAKYLHSDASIRKSITRELQPMDSTYTDMKRELKKTPDNKEIIEAMKLYYIKRDEVIDSIISVHKKNPGKNVTKEKK